MIEELLKTLSPFQIVSYIFLWVTLTLLSISMFKFKVRYSNPYIAYFIHGVATWIIHAIVFYSYLIYGNTVAIKDFNIIINGWSSGLRFHLILLLLLGSIFIYAGGKRWKSQQQSH